MLNPTKVNPEEKNDTIPLENYWISNVVLYIPEKGLLKYNSPIQTIKLQQPANKCLEFLLSKRFAVVSQKELMVYAWGEEKEKFVSTNAFYQTMFHLRRSLQKAGCDDLILSVPKKGSVINSDYSIFVTESDVPLKSGGNDTNRDSDAKKLVDRFKYTRYIAAVILSVTVFIVAFYSYIKSQSVDFYANYKITQDQRCNIYLPPGANKVDYYALLESAKIDCTQPQDVYITVRKGYLRNSLLVCSVKNKQRLCSAVTVMNKSVSLYEKD